jgi:hypothetical protein
MTDSLEGAAGSVTVQVSHTRTVGHEILFELSRATTAYYEATPDRIECAREEYEDALRKFKGTSAVCVPEE